MPFYDQMDYELRCEWGMQGLQALRAHSDVVVIVDVLSFTTCVAVAVGNGAMIYPFYGSQEQAGEYAASLGADLAGRKAGQSRYWLSPTSLASIPAGMRLVLPSPNGSRLSLDSAPAHTLAGCLRNAAATAQAARRLGKTIAVIPAGERWADGSLRPSLEDLLGAGAILHELPGKRSPEAQAAQEAFEACMRGGKTALEEALLACSSGRELVERERRADVLMAAVYNAGEAAARLVEGAYVKEELGREVNGAD